MWLGASPTGRQAVKLFCRGLVLRTLVVVHAARCRILHMAHWQRGSSTSASYSLVDCPAPEGAGASGGGGGFRNPRPKHP